VFVDVTATGVNAGRWFTSRCLLIYVSRVNIFDVLHIINVLRVDIARSEALLDCHPCVKLVYAWQYK
jgi:hypothetical protein